MRVWDLAVATPWAITTEALEVILAIAARDDVPLRAVEAMAGRPLDNTRGVSMRGGTAVIPIDGSIVRHGDMFTDVSGAVSVNTLAKDFTAALNDRSVRSILLSIDSPGGEVNGIGELADMIHAARGQKPIEAYISNLGCSAAYWLASACDSITCAASAQVGSIGVVAAVPNPEKDSKRTVQFVSSQSPNKRPNIATEGGRAQIQTRIDALADVFVAAVSRNRGVSPERVLADFGQGGVFVGRAAVGAGLVDGIGSFESALAALAAADLPVGHLPAPVTRKEGAITMAAAAPREPSRIERLMGWINGATDHAFDAIPEPAAGDGPPASASGAIPAQQAAPSDVAAHEEVITVAQDPEKEQLRKELAAARRETTETRADALLEGLVRGGQLTRAEVADWKDVYLAAGDADIRTGEGKLVPAITAALRGRPAQSVTGEKLAAGVQAGRFDVLPTRAITEGSDRLTPEAEADLDRENEAYVRRMNRGRGVAS